MLPTQKKFYLDLSFKFELDIQQYIHWTTLISSNYDLILGK